MESATTMIKAFVKAYPILWAGYNRACCVCHKLDAEGNQKYEACDKCGFTVCTTTDTCHLSHKETADAHAPFCAMFGVSNVNKLVQGLFESFKRNRENSSLFAAGLAETGNILYRDRNEAMALPSTLVHAFFSKNGAETFANTPITEIKGTTGKVTRGGYVLGRLEKISPTWTDSGMLPLLFATIVHEAWAYAPVLGFLLGFFNMQIRSRLKIAESIASPDDTTEPLPRHIVHDFAPNDDHPDMIPYQCYESEYLLKTIFLHNYGTPMAEETLKPVNVMYCIDLVHQDKEEATSFCALHPWSNASKEDRLSNSHKRPASTTLLVRLMGTLFNPVVQIIQQHSNLYTVNDWISGKLFVRREEERVNKWRMANHPEPEFSSLQSKQEQDITFQRVEHLVQKPLFASRDFQNGGIESIVQLARAIDTLALSDDPKERLAAYTDLTGVKWKGQLGKFYVSMFQANLVG